MDIAARLGDNLVRQRRLAGLTQEEVSVRTSLHRTEVSQLERGLRIPRVDTLLKLCGALECEAEELLDGIRWAPGETLHGHFGLDPWEDLPDA